MFKRKMKPYCWCV